LTGFEVQRGLFSWIFSSIFTGRLPSLFIEVRRRYTTGCGDQQSSAQDIGDRTSIQKKLEMDDSHMQASYGDPVAAILSAVATSATFCSRQ
jgi:hypothetical protein